MSNVGGFLLRRRSRVACILTVCSLLAISGLAHVGAGIGTGSAAAASTADRQVSNLTNEELRQYVESGKLDKLSFELELARRDALSSGASPHTPTAGLVVTPGLNTHTPTVGNPATATLQLEALEPATGLTVRSAHVSAGLGTTGGLPTAIDLATGDKRTLILTLVPSATGNLTADWVVRATVRGEQITRTVTLSLHVDDDPRASTFDQTISPLPAPSSPPAIPASTPSIPSPTSGGNRTKPILLLNGYLTSSEGGKNVNGEWSNVISALQNWGWTGQIGGVSFYNCDQNYSWTTEGHGSHSKSLGGRSQSANHTTTTWCGGSSPFPGFPPIGGYAAANSHTTDTAIEHVALHFAWVVRDVFGTQCVKTLAHSMGGLIVRYALARVSQGDTDFPLDICIDDVVTLGSTHGGTSTAGWWCPDYQCNEQRTDANFISWLGTYARDPQGAGGGTDWSALGSTGDDTAPPPASTDGNMNPAHAVVFEESQIEHSSSQGSVYWKNATASDITANIRWTDRAIGSEATTLDGPWPIRFTDMSLAYNHWGCGVGNMTSAFPLKNDVLTYGEPYTTSFDCWYYVDVPSGQSSLQVAMSSLNNRDLDLYVRYGSPTATPTCSQGTYGSSHTCSITNPAAGRWYVQVDNDWANSRDPFQVQAHYDAQVASSLTATSLTSYPSSVSPNQSYQVCWSVAGSGSISHTDIHYGTSSSLGSNTPAQTGTAPSSFCANLTAPSAGTVYIQSHASGPANSVNSSTATIPVTATQNDCGTGLDAGGSHAAATSISLPKSNCSGALTTSTDAEDWYQFSVTSGQSISLSMTPNASSDFDLCLWDPANSTSNCSGAGTGSTDSVTVAASTTGYWRARVYIYGSSPGGSYTMSVSATSPSQNDCGTGADAGGSASSAASITLPVSNCQGSHPASSDDMDWYKFYVTSGQVITASMTPASGPNFDLCLNSPSNVTVACSSNGGSATDTITYTATATGYWTVDTYISSGTGTYMLSVSASAAQNDCGTGGDAGGSHAAAASISLPKSSCTGALPGGDSEDWYQFSVTSGQSVSISMTPGSSADYDLCLVNPTGTSVGCSTAGTGSTDSVTYTADVTGSWRARIYWYSGASGSYTFSASASGGGTVVFRDDDNEKDVDLRMNYNDDVAVKRFNISSAQLSGKTYAVIQLWGESWGCPSSVGNKYRLRANGNTVYDFNPCDLWSSTSFGWAGFVVPVSYLVAGTNSFDFQWLGGDWTSGNVYLGVDTDNDFGRSDTSYDSTTLNGELMWYLTLS